MHTSASLSTPATAAGSPLKKPVSPEEQPAFRPEDLKELSEDLCGRMATAIKRFGQINLETQILSINAAIEASRAGQAGASFAVVANQMKQLSHSTEQVADSLATDVQAALDKINDFSLILSTQVRGTRLTDLALNNIDLIDRNLYERSCDVRWWATDSSIWEACANPTTDSLKHASGRLGVILDAYTVYYDLVLCDLNGEVIANGRPNKYRSKGTNCSGEQWFRQAKASSSGDEFGFQPVHTSSLAGGKPILAYSCSVRAHGSSYGEVVGVLGILFNWDALAQEIVKGTPISDDEWKRTRVCIVDDDGRLLADTAESTANETLKLDRFSHYTSLKKTFEIDNSSGRDCLIAYAKAPGYETYTTGWHSFIIQETE